MSVSVKATAPGKVNLYFAVGPLKSDGYHDVASLYAAVDILETVTLTETDAPGMSQSMSVAHGSPVAQQMELGAFDPSVVPLDHTNLAYRGAAAVLDEAGLSPADVCLNLHIEKAVPVAGGMGGGSNITVNVTSANPDDVVAALQRWVRNNGSLALSTTAGVRF